VLMMQYLWVYVDDIIGKGAGLLMLMELISYMVVSLIPMALPIAILISSVMVLGNLAERYELSSMKSAGIPLWRIMFPLMIIAAGISVFSFYCSDSLIPISNLQFKSRLYDIRKQRPTLSMEEGIFNDDFKGFVIRIGKKDRDDEGIEDVLIYDHSKSNENRMTSIAADKGKMYTSKDERFFVMHLQDGYQYYELKPTYNEGKRSYPFVRTEFEEWTKVFDLSVFNIQETDKDLFKSHHTMLSVSQLRDAIDTIDYSINLRNKNFAKNFDRYFDQFELIEAEKEMLNENNSDKIEIDSLGSEGMKYVKKKASQKRKMQRSTWKPLFQTIPEDFSAIESLIETFPRSNRAELLEKSKSYARSISTQANTTESSLVRIVENRVKHIFELHSKFSLAVACFIFLFIGAPMGAIVRKGGFGYPILISIIFFMIYVTLTIMGKKLAESNTLPAALAAWGPCLILFPIGVWLTIKAMNDSKLLNVDRISIFLNKLISKIGKRETDKKETGSKKPESENL